MDILIVYKCLQSRLFLLFVQYVYNAVLCLSASNIISLFEFEFDWNVQGWVSVLVLVLQLAACCIPVKSDNLCSVVQGLSTWILLLSGCASGSCFVIEGCSEQFTSNSEQWPSYKFCCVCLEFCIGSCKAVAIWFGTCVLLLLVVYTKKRSEDMRLLLKTYFPRIPCRDRLEYAPSRIPSLNKRRKFVCIMKTVGLPPGVVCEKKKKWTWGGG